MRLRGKDGIGRVIYTAAVSCTPCVREEDAEDSAQRAVFGAYALEGVKLVTKRLQTVKRRMLADRDVRATYDALSDEFDLARELIAARVRAGLTQAEVAERMGTTQSVVARLESGAQMPSVNTLLKFAKATRSRPIIKLLAA
jgi:ribosome-binding protein aMBF1 (putative translation factor)